MSTKILVAMVGSTAETGGGKSCGMLVQGFCVPLAATPEACRAIETVGDDGLADLLEGDSVGAPKAGGLWVLECTMHKSSEDGCKGYLVESHGWRPPTEGELRGLLQRQLARAHREDPDPPAGDARWTFIGALV